MKSLNSGSIVEEICPWSTVSRIPIRNKRSEAETSETGAVVGYTGVQGYKRESKEIDTVDKSKRD